MPLISLCPRPVFPLRPVLAHENVNNKHKMAHKIAITLKPGGYGG